MYSTVGSSRKSRGEGAKIKMFEGGICGHVVSTWRAGHDVIGYPIIEIGTCPSLCFRSTTRRQFVTWEATAPTLAWSVWRIGGCQHAKVLGEGIGEGRNWRSDLNRLHCEHRRRDRTVGSSIGVGGTGGSGPVGNAEGKDLQPLRLQGGCMCRR